MTLNPQARAQVVMALLRHAVDGDFETLGQRVATMEHDEIAEIIPVLCAVSVHLLVTLCPTLDMVMASLEEQITQAAEEDFENEPAYE